MSVYIHSNTKIGNNFQYGHNLIIEKDVEIGDNVKLGHNVVLKSGTRIGNNVNFSDYCKTTGACIVGNNVNVRTGATISKAVILEDCVFIGPDVMTNHTKHVTHCRPNAPTSFLTTRIGYGSVIGANCWLAAGTKISDNVFIGGATSVIKNIEVSGIYVGAPPRMLYPIPDELYLPVPEDYTKHNFSEEIINHYLPGIKE